MSTYLVALIVSDFKCKETYATLKLTQPVKVRVCARPDAAHQLSFSLNVSTKIFQFFEEFYNVSYPLPKLGI
jgi:aminopeptidase 2